MIIICIYIFYTYIYYTSIYFLRRRRRKLLWNFVSFFPHTLSLSLWQNGAFVIATRHITPTNVTYWIGTQPIQQKKTKHKSTQNGSLGTITAASQEEEKKKKMEEETLRQWNQLIDTHMYTRKKRASSQLSLKLKHLQIRTRTDSRTEKGSSWTWTL